MLFFFFFSQLAIKPITSLQIMCVCYSVKVWTCRTVAAIRPLCVKKSLLFAVNFNSQCESREILSTYTITAPFQAKNVSFFKHCIWNNKHCSQEEFQYSCCRVQLCFFKIYQIYQEAARWRGGGPQYLSKSFFFLLFFSLKPLATFLHSPWQHTDLHEPTQRRKGKVRLLCVIPSRAL